MVDKIDHLVKHQFPQLENGKVIGWLIAYFVWLSGGLNGKEKKIELLYSWTYHII